MKKTYVTKMHNHIGAFLKASKCFSELGINITRVSYNKAVDSHTLFIEVDGEESQFEKANEKLKEIGYLSNGDTNTKIVLIEFRLEDKPGRIGSHLSFLLGAPQEIRTPGLRFRRGFKTLFFKPLG